MVGGTGDLAAAGLSGLLDATDGVVADAIGRDGVREDRLQHGEDLQQRRIAGAGAAHRLDKLTKDHLRSDRAQLILAQPRQDVLAPLLTVGLARLRLQVRDRVLTPVVLDELGQRDVVLKAHQPAKLLATDALAPKRVTVTAAIKRPLALTPSLAPAIDPLAIALATVRHGSCAPFDFA